MSPTTISSATPGPYGGWTREQLIERLTLLEKQAQSTDTNAPTQISTPIPKDIIPFTKRYQDKEFDFSRYAKRKIALKFCYSGWEYGGLAFQLGPTPLPTVENVIFDAMVKAKLVDPEGGFDGCGWEKCGRTDRGVSAAGQVITLWIRNRTKPQYEHDYLNILNKILPDTIRILAWSPVSEQFSARFSCKFRDYKYFFSSIGLDIPSMQKAAERLIGEHDFRNLCKLDAQKQITSFKRKILRATVEPVDPQDPTDSGDKMYVFDLVGTAFLYHQVRHIMAVLFLVGTGLEPPSIVTQLMNVEQGLEAMHPDDAAAFPNGSYPVVNSKPEYQMADALPLMLWDCGYDPAELDWRTTGKPDDGGGRKAIGGDLYNQVQAIHNRSRVFSALDQYFLRAVAEFHPPPAPVFPLKRPEDVAEIMRAKEAMNIPLGGGTFKRNLKHVPVISRKRLDTVEVMNERWRLGKGLRKDEKKKGADIDDGNE
ncbi:pseudouridine synthase [Panaeolus papilionaceus]|nr:pseudouridine synthase [Panaeolus papilionaceus]